MLLHEDWLKIPNGSVDVSLAEVDLATETWKHSRLGLKYLALRCAIRRLRTLPLVARAMY